MSKVLAEAAPKPSTAETTPKASTAEATPEAAPMSVSVASEMTSTCRFWIGHGRGGKDSCDDDQDDGQGEDELHFAPGTFQNSFW